MQQEEKDKKNKKRTRDIYIFLTTGKTFELLTFCVFCVFDHPIISKTVQPKVDFYFFLGTSPW